MPYIINNTTGEIVKYIPEGEIYPYAYTPDYRMISDEELERNIPIFRVTSATQIWNYFPLIAFLILLWLLWSKK